MNLYSRSIAFAAAALCAAATFAQEPGSMFNETMFSSGKINVVVAVVAAILLGLAIWLFAMDRRLKRMEDQMKK